MTQTTKVYESVPSTENDDLDNLDVVYTPRIKRVNSNDDLVDRALTIIHSLLWVLGVAIMWFYADIYNTVRHTKSDKINYIALSFAGILGALAASCIAYVFLHTCRKNNTEMGQPQDFLDAYPRAIHTATFAGVLSLFSIILSIWPIYGWKSLFIVTITSIGALMGLNLIPF